jgi:hypothetical protein
LDMDGINAIDVPNLEGTGAPKISDEWDGWSPPYHYWHFTFKSLKKLLDQYGFKIIKYKDYHPDVVKIKLKGISIVGLFARLIAKLYSGTSIAVIARLEK